MLLANDSSSLSPPTSASCVSKLRSQPTEQGHCHVCGLAFFSSDVMQHPVFFSRCKKSTTPAATTALIRCALRTWTVLPHTVAYSAFTVPPRCCDCSMNSRLRLASLLRLGVSNSMIRLDVILRRTGREPRTWGRRPVRFSATLSSSARVIYAKILDISPSASTRITQVSRSNVYA